MNTSTTPPPDLIARHCACCRRAYDPRELDTGDLDPSIAGMCYTCASTPADQRGLRVWTDRMVIDGYRAAVARALTGVVNGIYTINARNMLAELLRRRIDPFESASPPTG